MGKRQDQARYQQRPLKQTWKRWPTCYAVFSARSGRRKRYRLSGKEVSWLSCPRKETSGTATTTEGSCSCQCQTKCSTEFYWRGWKRQSTPSSETSRLASAETDHIGSVRIIVEQSLEWNSPLYINFIDNEKAFDSVDRETLWKLLRHYGFPEKIIALIRCTYQDMSCKIAHAGQLSESFEVKTGVRQGHLLSPFLFLLVIDWIMKTTTTGRNNGIQWTPWTQLDDLNFADDLVLLSHNHRHMQDKTTCLETISAGTGLKISKRKTELMKINTTANTPVTVDGEPIREVHSFIYLGSAVDRQGGTDRDVTARIGKARVAFVMLKNIWSSKEIRTRTKLRIFNSNVKSVLLYGCETWRTTKTMLQKIQTFFNTFLRRIYNTRWPEMIPNEELWERAGQEPVAKQILKRKWGWIGHTLSITRQALTWNPQGKRKRGRPCNSWRQDTEAELKQQGTNWTGAARLAQNRVRWRGVVDGLCSTRSHVP